MSAQTLLINRGDFRDMKTVDLPDAPLADGHIRVDIGPFAITANNVTYLVTGDMIGYWNFFKPSAYRLDAPGYGRMPVWGYGTVTESQCEGIKTGARVYGFFPLASQIDLKPGKISAQGFMDFADHRRALHPVYNSYVLTAADPAFAPALDDLQPILRPLFTTSFLIDDFLADEDFFGAEQVLLLSASSKTALGTAYCLKQRGGIKVSGLTSEANLEFVKSTGFYDGVYTYDNITDTNPDVKTAIVDMAGNGAVSETLYGHFEENIVYNCMVGKSHWQGGPPPKAKLGAPPIMFFAPDRAKLRMGDWGAAGFAQNLAARWLPFCKSAQSWLTIKNHTGMDSALSAYTDLLDGKAAPSTGHLFTL